MFKFDSQEVSLHFIAIKITQHHKNQEIYSEQIFGWFWGRCKFPSEI